MVSITAGSTDVTLYVYFVDDDGGTAPGEPTTGLLFSDIETGGSASYARQGAARTDVTLITLASASAAHADGGFILVDDTNMPGLYRVDIPDAAFATGADFVIIHMVAASANNSITRPLLVSLNNSAGMVWDEALSGHLTLGTTGRSLQLAGAVLIDTTVTGTPSSTQFQLTDGSTIDGFYHDQEVQITSGTGAAQARIVEAYIGATKTITVDEAFVTTPASGDGVVVISNHTHTVSGIANAIWDEVMVETTGAPAVTGTFRNAMEWIFGLSRNKITQTVTTTTLRNDADDADLATSTVSDDATTYTRGEWST